MRPCNEREGETGSGLIYIAGTDYWYDDAGNLIKTATGKIGSGTTLTGYGQAQKYSYDGLGRASEKGPSLIGRLPVSVEYQ